MSTKKSLDKVIGWFVEREPEEAAAEPAPDSGDRSRAAAPNPGAQRAPALPPAAATGEGGFVEVYRAAGVPAEEHDRVERALELLRTLPPGVPIDARRAIVTASLGAFGIPVERILETAGTELRALDGHVSGVQQRSEAGLAGARARIEALEGEIAEIRQLMAAEGRRQEEIAAATGAERARVRALFEFFGKGPLSAPS